MVFFTCELFLGYQPGSSWERKALREWDRRVKLYDRYLDFIEAMLPPSVRRLCKNGPHDGVVREARFARGELVLVGILVSPNGVELPGS